MDKEDLEHYLLRYPRLTEGRAPQRFNCLHSCSQTSLVKTAQGRHLAKSSGQTALSDLTPLQADLDTWSMPGEHSPLGVLVCSSPPLS